jgi:NTE family protein
LGEDEEVSSTKTFTIFRYLQALFFAFRYFYDKEFLSNNKEYSMLVKEVSVKDVHGKEIDWLDFQMSTDKKRQLFMNGVKAACEFLKDYDWMAVKKARLEQYRQMHPN